MLKRVALSGEALAGKTTLARYLVEHYGYRHASVSDYIISEYIKLINDPWMVDMRGGQVLSAQDIIQDKHSYRVALQQMGADLGLDREESVIATLSSVLRCAGAWDNPDEPVVLEAIRGELQASAARALGFVVVNLWADEQTRHERAGSEGTYHKIQVATRVRPDIESGVDSASILLTSALPVEDMAKLISIQPEEGLSHGPTTQPFTPYSFADWSSL